MRASLLGIVVRGIALGIASAATAVACGGTTTGPGGPGGSSGSGTVSGTVGGTTFVVASEVAVVGPASSSCATASGPDGGGSETTCTGGGQAVIILLTNRADATCGAVQAAAAAQQNIAFARLAGLELLVSSPTGTVTPTTYQVGPQTGPSATGVGATFATTDATCAAQQVVEAQSGTVTVTAMDATRVSGSYDLSFGKQGSFSGSFDVPLCTLPDGGVGDGVDAGPPTCK